jgi:SHS2 domain-containing protein
MGARHDFAPHGDAVRLHVDAPTLEALFTEAARGLAELQLEQAVEMPAEALSVESIHLDAPDVETLLVDWLNELILRSTARGVVYIDVAVERASERDLDAVVRGLPPGERLAEIRGADIHDVEVHLEDGELCAYVALEVDPS